MGKLKGKKAGRIKRHDPMNVPLAAQIEGPVDQDGDIVTARDGSTRKTKRRQAKRKNTDDDLEEVMDTVMEQKIMRFADEQAREERELAQPQRGKKKVDGEPRVSFAAGGFNELSDDDSFGDMEGGDFDGQEYYEELELTEADEADLARFMNPNAGATRTIADLIMEKLEEKKNQGAFASNALEKSLNPKVVQVYKGVGQILSRYSAGKLPRAFKAIPNLRNWEEILYLTRPDDWSSAAMYQATRVFASNLRPAAAQRFYGLVLLPRVRDDIEEYHKLNFHLYQSLKKALYKPGAFYKGILLPLCEERNCTLREATIVGSVLQKVSIPMLHSAAALLKLSEMEYSGPVSLFMRILLNKKYALPYRVLDAIVNHFIEFIGDTREMPVLWHQCLLTFVQRYKTEITAEEKEMLKKLLRIKVHPKITPEIRRELFNAPSRGEQPDVPVDPMMG